MYYALKFRLILIDIVGTIAINKNIEVLDDVQELHPSLYAAGVITSDSQERITHFMGREHLISLWPLYLKDYRQLI